MRQNLLFAAFLSMILPSTLRADVAAPPPPASRVASVDAIVVGRIVAHEDKDVETLYGPGGAKVVFRVALINPSERIIGVKDAKVIRVAYIAKKEGGFRRPGTPQLEIGLDGVFFLTKHFSEDFYIAPMYFDFYARTSPEFEREMPVIRRKAKMLDDPIAHLKSKDVEERFDMASLLVSRYRAIGLVPPMTRAVSLGEEESKLILKAILDANWDRPQMFGHPHPWSTFLQLGVTAKEGWMIPMGAKNVQEFHKAARAWLENNWQTHRVQKVERVRK